MKNNLMTDSSEQKNPRVGLLIILMGLILIATLTGIGVVRSLSTTESMALAPPALTSTASDTPTPTATETITPTPSRTPRPTWTLRVKPSATATNTLPPTSTPTLTRLPTITPALPNRFNDRYSLNPWTAQDAGNAADTLLGYPDALFPAERSRQSAAYNAAFQSAAFAYREALLRFPGDSRERDWQWRLAYSLARIGDEKASSLYAQLILAGIRQGASRVDDLPEWFRFYEKNQTLRIESIPIEPGQLSQKLVVLEEAGLVYWLIETPNNVQLLPLIQTPNFASNRQTGQLIGDFTGDGLAEVILAQVNTSNAAQLSAFTVLQGNLVQLPIEPALPVDLRTNFEFSLYTGDAASFVIQYNTFPACPAIFQQAYRWNGSAFIPSQVAFQVEPQADLLLSCEETLTHARNAWEPEMTLSILRALEPLWPPAADAKGRPYPADARDELRFQIGVYEALSGNPDMAVRALQDLQQTPADRNSPWITAARQFLSRYQTPQDLYRACQPEATCDMRAALRQLTEAASLDNPVTAQEYLRQAGVPIRSSGVFDFDKDGKAERWLTIRHRENQNLEFWLLAQTPKGVSALFVTTVLTDRVAPNSSLEETLPPIVQLEPRQGFRLERLAATGEAMITYTAVEPLLTTYTRDKLAEAVEAILSGVDPRLVRDELETVLQSGRFNCKTHRVCDRFLYTLGLAYELSGDERKAVDTYIKLWWENKNSPYTTIARLKLKYNPPATATPPATPTSTATPDGAGGNLSP